MLFVKVVVLFAFNFKTEVNTWYNFEIKRNAILTSIHHFVSTFGVHILTDIQRYIDNQKCINHMEKMCKYMKMNENLSKCKNDTKMYSLMLMYRHFAKIQFFLKIELQF